MRDERRLNHCCVSAGPVGDALRCWGVDGESELCLLIARHMPIM